MIIDLETPSKYGFISARYEGFNENGIVTVRKLLSYDITTEEEYINYIRLKNLKKLLNN